MPRDFFKKSIFILLPFLVLVVFTNFSFAAVDEGIYTYVFHLYFDNGKLVKDKDFKFPFDLIAQQFEPAIEAGMYRGEIISIGSKKLADFNFSLNSDVIKNNKGKLTVYAPYFADAKTAVFYGPQGGQLLILDLAPAGPVCNDDGVCNSDVGENQSNCPNDCKELSLSPLPSISQPPAVVGGGPSLMIFIIIAIAVIAIVILVIWVIIKKRKAGSNAPSELPPAPPSITQ